MLTNAECKTNALMHIAVFVDRAMIWQWHKWLVDRLLQAGHQVDLSVAGTASETPVNLRLLLQAERLLYRRGTNNASDLISIEQFDEAMIIDQPADSGHDLVIDLAGTNRHLTFSARCFRPLYNGKAGVHDLIGTLLDGHAPSLSLDDSAQSDARRFGLCAIEQPMIVSQGLNNVFSRMAELLLKSVLELSQNREPLRSEVKEARSAIQTPRSGPLKAERFLLGNLGAKITSRLQSRINKRAVNEMRWGVGWRFTDGHPLHKTNEFNEGQYTRLKDDGQRFFADPFVVSHEGLHHVFVEEFPFDTKRGIISHLTIDEQGNASAPQMVLSRPYHLSYPFIFEHDGDFWMIPETSANRTVELYRATSFPDEWRLEKTLLKDVRADDVTLVRYQERWWLFAAVGEWQSSQWDALGLFYADDLLGPWHAHQANPVLVDATAARPAGAMYRQDGDLWRPAQDCSSIYGGGLSLCRVDRLDPERYEQSVVKRFAPDANGPLQGFHTLNEHQGLEVIDFWGRL